MKEHGRSRRNAIKAIGAASVFGLAGCSGDGSDGSTPTATEDTGDSTDSETATSSDTEQMDTVRAAFIYESPLGDVGWDRSHENGRQAVEEEYDWVETAYSDDVAPGDVRSVIENYISEDYDVIFGTTFGYMDPMSQLAPEYPDTVFEHCSGFLTEENMGRYYGRLYQPRFLTGVAAGHLTETNVLGYVASFPISEVIRQLNAFALGAASVNPDVTMKVRWTNAWMDPPATTEATNALLDEDADVINNHITSPASVRTADENDAWGFTYTTSMSEQGGDNYGASAIWQWEEFYGPTLEAVRDGTWESDSYWEGMDSDVVALDEFGPNVPDDVVSEVEEKEQQIVDGELDVWEGSEFEDWSDEDLFQNVDVFADPVEGEPPSG